MKSFFTAVIVLLGFSASAQDWKNHLVTGYIPNIGLDSNNRIIAASAGKLMAYDQGSWSFLTGTYRESSGIATDPLGNIWSVSVTQQGNFEDGGLIKYNGTSTTTYTPQNSGLISIYVTHVASDPSGRIWVGTEEGLSSFDGTSWVNYTSSNSGLPSDLIRWVAAGQDGSIWVATSNGTARLYQNVWTTYNTSNSGINSNEVRSICIDAAGKKWFASSSGVSAFDGTSWVNYTVSNSGIASDDVRHITGDAQGNTWFATSSGISKLNGTTWTSYNANNGILPSNDIAYLQLDRNGKLWATTGKRVFEFDGQTAISHSLEVSSAVNQIHTITFDDQQNKWLGTYYTGFPADGPVDLQKFTGTTPSPYNFQVASIAADRNNRVWLASSELIKIDGQNTTTYNGLNSPIAENLSCVYVDKAGNKWISSAAGVAKFDDNIWTNFPVGNMFPGSTDDFNATTIAPDSSGNVWFSFANGISANWNNVSTLTGLVKYDGTNWSHVNTGNSGLLNDVVSDIVVEASGAVWFATGAGLSKLLPGGTWVNYTTANSGLINNQVKALAIDQNDHLWVGTTTGLVLYDGQNWTNYQSYNPILLTANIKKLEIDLAGKLWILYENAGRTATFMTELVLNNCPGAVNGNSLAQTACGIYVWNGKEYTISGLYTHRYTNGNGCPSVDTLHLIIQTPSIDPLSVSASATTVMQGTSVTMQVTGGQLGTNAFWKWYTGNCGGTLVGTGASLTVTPNATTTYYVRAEGPCNNTICLSVTITVQVLVCGPTAVWSNAEDNAICGGARITLTVRGTLTSGASWNWYRNGCGTGRLAGKGSSITVMPSVTTTYFVRSEGGICGSTNCMSIQVIVNDQPEAPADITGSNNVCAGVSTSYSCTPVTGAIYYGWILPAGWSIISGQGTNSIVVNPGAENGFIRVSAYSFCGTGRQASRRVNSRNCTKAPVQGNLISSTNLPDAEIAAWPIPANDYVNLRTTGPVPDRIELYNAFGQLVHASSWTNRIETGRMQSGFYVLRIYRGEKYTVKKIHIIH